MELLNPIAEVIFAFAAFLGILSLLIKLFLRPLERDITYLKDGQARFEKRFEKLEAGQASLEKKLDQLISALKEKKVI